VVFIIVISFIIAIFVNIALLIFLSPPCLPGEVGLVEYVCTHLFIVVFFFSSRSRLRARGVRVAGVHTQVSA
jgi:hypothetical protein